MGWCCGDIPYNEIQWNTSDTTKYPRYNEIQITIPIQSKTKTSPNTPKDPSKMTFMWYCPLWCLLVGCMSECLGCCLLNEPLDSSVEWDDTMERDVCLSCAKHCYCFTNPAMMLGGGYISPEKGPPDVHHHTALSLLACVFLEWHLSLPKLLRVLSFQQSKGVVGTRQDRALVNLENESWRAAKMITHKAINPVKPCK